MDMGFGGGRKQGGADFYVQGLNLCATCKRAACQALTTGHTSLCPRYVAAKLRTWLRGKFTQHSKILDSVEFDEERLVSGAALKAMDRHMRGSEAEWKDIGQHPMNAKEDLDRHDALVYRSFG